jgi:hypothetical protein
MSNVIHIAGLGLIVGGRFARQRCAWCGEILVEEDATLIASTDPGPRDPCWPINSLVRVRKEDGFVAYERIDQSDFLPVDCCAYSETRTVPKLEIVK